MATNELPLISCIMPTTPARSRFRWAAIRGFLAQDYPRKELIVVDEDAWPAKRHEFAGVRVLFVRADQPLSIGAKRNLAVAQAGGQIICHWDDDDEYASDRLSRQAAPILAGEADITGMPLELVRDLTRENCEPQTWRCSPRLADALFALGVHGGTLMYRRALWCATAAFENSSSGEDGGFLRLLLARGARLVAVPNNGSFIYVRHDPANRWPLDEAMEDSEAWELVA